MTVVGTFQTCRNVQLESVMRLIVLQKSFLSTGHKFFELWARQSNNHVGDHIKLR
jgi:hypothetical protein